LRHTFNVMGARVLPFRTSRAAPRRRSGVGSSGAPSPHAPPVDAASAGAAVSPPRPRGPVPAPGVPALDGGGDDLLEHANLDRMLHAALARFSGGISPESVIAAYTDWLTHLAASPGKQQWLVRKAWRKLLRLWLHASEKEPGTAIEPLPQDRRFDHPGWQRYPFNLLYQSFLLTQQWWHNATAGVHGVSRHHEHMVTFMARQWLDVFSPSNYLVTNPEVLEETVARGGANLLQGAMNWAEDAARVVAERPLPEAARFRPGETVALTEGTVVFRNALIELIQYAPRSRSVYADPLLIVPSWIMKYYILDLSPGNSLVSYLVDRGHTVFMISWRNPQSADRNVGMEDYLEKGVLAALAAVTAVVPDRPVHAAGYCLGGTLLAIAAATLARRPGGQFKSLTLLAAELDFTEPGELSLFIDESQIAYLEDIMWDQGFLDGRQMAGAFTLLNSRDLVWSKAVHDYLMGTRQPLTDLMAWNADATRLPFRMHSEYLNRLYLENELAEGRYPVGGRPIALEDIRAPLFVVGTERDHVSPWRSVFKTHLLIESEITFLLTSGGHNVGVVNPPGVAGRHYRVLRQKADRQYIDPDGWYASVPPRDGSWWPEWQAWLAGRSGRRVRPPPTGAPKRGCPALQAAPGSYVHG